MSRAELARQLEEKVETLANYEDGRAALPFSVFAKLWTLHRVNPQYLAEDIGPESLSESAFSVIPLNAEPRERFSAFYGRRLSLIFNSPQGRAASVREWLMQFRDSLLVGLCKGLISAEQIRPLREALERVERDVAAGKFGFGSTTKKAMDEALALPRKQAVTQSAPMDRRRSRLYAFREHLKLITAPRGMKTRLAKDMGVTSGTVTQWLDGTSAPSAENTLRLLEWVATIEDNQKSAAPELRPPTRLMAQARNPVERKTNSGAPRSSRKRP